jgi:thioredoxin reductase (NADPH)
VRLTLYSRAWCHLCHDMEALVRQVQAELASECAFELEILDVDADPVLEARYNELVPVLMRGERELARYHLDPDALRHYLKHQPPQDELRRGNAPEIRPEIL